MLVLWCYFKAVLLWCPVTWVTNIWLDATEKTYWSPSQAVPCLWVIFCSIRKQKFDFMWPRPSWKNAFSYSIWVTCHVVQVHLVFIPHDWTLCNIILPWCAWIFARNNNNYCYVHPKNITIFSFCLCSKWCLCKFRYFGLLLIVISVSQVLDNAACKSLCKISLCLWCKFIVLLIG